MLLLKSIRLYSNYLSILFKYLLFMNFNTIVLSLCRDKNPKIFHPFYDENQTQINIHKKQFINQGARTLIGKNKLEL